MESPVPAQQQTLVVTPPPNLDMHAAAEFKRTMMRWMQRRPAVLALDMSRVTYLDALPLAVVAHARREAALQGTEIVLVGLQGQPRAFVEEWAPDPPLVTHTDLAAAAGGSSRPVSA